MRNKKLKLVYFGHGKCGSLGLKTIKENYIHLLDLMCVVNHRETSDDPDIVPNIAKEMKINIYEGKTENPEFVEFLQEQKPDFGVIMRHPHKIKKEVYSAFKEGLYNTHPTDLPKGRGISPLEFVVAEGGPLIATSFRVSENFDDGPILCKTQGTDISGMYIEDVFPLAVYETNKVLRKTLDIMIKGNYTLKKQDETKSTTARRKDVPRLLTFSFEDSSTLLIYRKILARGKNGTRLYFGNKEVSITVKNYEEGKHIGEIGTVIYRGKDSLLQCKDGILIFDADSEIQENLSKREVPYDFKQQY